MLAVLLGLLATWLLLIVVLWRAKPGTLAVGEAVRLLPDAVRLVARLARDPTLSRGLRLRLLLLVGYLAVPFDLVPDVIPVLGYADDVLLVALVLRGVVRRAGPGALERHWPGTPEGLAVLRSALRL